MKKILALLLVGLLLVGCGGMGKSANIISEFQYGDDKKSCNQLEMELISLKDDIQHMSKKAGHVKSGNAMIAVLGGLLFFPALFAMDFSETEEKELRALEKRYNTLKQIAMTKECEIEFKTDDKVKVEVVNENEEYPTVEDEK